MASRLELQAKLEEILGEKHVYFMPPDSVKIAYPAIIYSVSGILTKKANNKKYLRNTKYTVIVIGKRPMDSIVNQILELPYSEFDRNYQSDNLYHSSLTLYY